MCPDQMALGEVGFIKIDVEGHELDVLAGLSACIARCLPNLLIEVGGTYRGGSLVEVRGRLEPLGYIALRLNESGVLRVLPKEIDIKGSLNIIFIPMSGSPLAQTGPGRVGGSC